MVFEGQTKDALGLINTCEAGLTDHKNYMITKAYQGNSRIYQVRIRWMSPLHGECKFNLDGSIYRDGNSVVGG